MTLGAKIQSLRKQKGLTQEALAVKLSVSNQAVSKWEAEQCCPDISLLPQLADLFEVSIDALFDRTVVPPTTDTLSLPWEDDNSIHAVLFIGHRLQAHHRTDSVAGNISLEFRGNVTNIHSDFSVQCHDSIIHGNVTAGDSISCGDVCGNVSAGDGVNCGNVGGDVGAGDGVCCGNIEGNVSAGDSVYCGNIDGSVSAGDSVTCGNVGGTVIVENIRRNP